MTPADTNAGMCLRSGERRPRLDGIDLALNTGNLISTKLEECHWDGS